jgi:hypothetical protein
MKTRQINSGFGYQRRKASNKIQEFKYYMTAPVIGGAVTVGCFELVTNLGVCRYWQPFL